LIQDPYEEARYMLHVGVDVHKKSLQVCVLDERGYRAQDVRVENSQSSVAGYFSQVRRPSSVALEASHNWGAIYDLLDGQGFDVHICHSKQAKLIGLASVKNDKVDAFKLATLLRAGLLPEAYVPSREGRELRCLVRSRASLKGTSTRLKNQIHAILRSNWVSHPYSDLFGKAGREFLRSLEIEDSYKLAILSRLEVLEGVEREISRFDGEICRQAQLDVRAMMVATAPGFAEFRSIMLLSEVENISRFRRPESFVCFTGLIPREHSSGESTRRGRITKEGSSWLRWIFVEAAQQAIKEDGKIRDLYLRVLEKRGHNRAIVAAARELAVSVYWMLTRMEPYRASGKKRTPVN
jgi:transposase